MNYIFSKIEESEFDSLDCPILFGNKPDRVFAKVLYKSKKYRFSWQSTEIEPSFKEIQKATYAIGIDQNFLVINFDTGEIKNHIHLDHFFYETKIFDNFLLVISELKIIKIRLNDYVIIEEYDLPDYFESLNNSNDTIDIYCIDGSVLNI